MRRGRTCLHLASLALSGVLSAGCGSSSSSQAQPLSEQDSGTVQDSSLQDSQPDSGSAKDSADSSQTDVEVDSASDTGSDSGDVGVDAPSSLALLELYPLDIWAQPMPAGEMTLSVKKGTTTVQLGTGQFPTIALSDPGSYTVEYSSPEHETLSVTIDYKGGASLDAATLKNNAPLIRHGISFSHEQRTIGGKSIAVHTAYLGLRHKWFSAQGRPARRGNELAFMISGEEAWGQVRQDLLKAKKNIFVSTWWWQSDFELLRDPVKHMTQSATERWPNSILGTLELSPATRRVLVGQLWGQDSSLGWMTIDDKLKAYAVAPNDKFEFMGQANETEGKFFFEVAPFSFGERIKAQYPSAKTQTFAPETDVESTVPARNVDLTQWPVGVQVQHASYHQKFMVIDSELAFIGGMNLKEADWDTPAHAVFEPRRMLFDSTAAQRAAVLAKTELPDQGPRKDYMVRILGPAAQDAADVFHERWMNQLASKVEYSANSSPFDVDRAIAERANGKQIQVTATLPKPFLEHAIAETWFNAVAHAEKYIYIEDQYFRMPMLNEAIVTRMTQVPALRLIVITKTINEWTDPGCAWTYKSHELFKKAFPTRYMMLMLRSFDYVDVGWGVDETESRYADIDTHSKMLIVDDKFMSVGSCNKNNRGLVYEGELNVAVLDPTWVRDARRRILANMLPSGTPQTDDVATIWTQFTQAAAYNDTVYANWETEGGDISLDGAALPAKYIPKGLVHGQNFGDLSQCLMESVGPDMVSDPH